MPTVVVIDVSASLLRPADPSDPNTTRQDVAQRGILHLLQWLERWQELEPICLVTMGSESRVLVPFETDHKKLRMALYDIAIEDGASISNGLLTACGLLHEHFGVSAEGCQVVMVVDGGPCFTELPALDALLPSLPRSMVFHALMLGTEAEVKRGSPFYQSLAARLRGSFTPILLPQDTGAYKRGFSGLAARFYHPYSASLVCGHMQCALMLYPDPNLGRDVPPAEMHPAVAAETVGGGEGLGGTAMVAIRGFIPKEAFVHVVGGVEVPMIPVERKHVILPDARGGGAEGESFAGAAGGETGAFLNLLLQALTTEEAVAVCHLRSGPASAAGGEGGAAGGGAGADLDDTACFIMPGSGGGKADKGQHLVLLVPRLAGETGAARLHLLASTPVFDIPALRILPQHPPTSETLPSPDTLPADLAKFAKMLGQLPAKKDGAYKEAERLRRSSQVHMMPSVLAASSALIEAASQDLAAAAESSSAGGKDSDRGEQADRTLSAAILQDLREQLSRSDPSQVVVRPRTPPPAKRSKTTPNAAALSNLMN